MEGNSGRELGYIFAIAADGLAAAPTVLKSFKAPETENYQVYLFNAIGAVITLFTIKQWDFAHWAFPLYIFLVGFMLFLLIRFRLGKKIQ